MIRNKALNLTISFIFLGFTLFPCKVLAEEQVCIPTSKATNLIQILDATERNLELLESCTALVDQLYNEIEIRDRIIEKQAREIVELKKEVARLNKLRDREKVLRYAGIGAIIFTIVKLAGAAGAI